MIAILVNIFTLLIFLIFLFVFIILLIWMWSAIKSKVPFIPVSNSILKDIENALYLKEDSVVYNLGCGDGRVLTYLYNNNPKATYIGIENSPFPYLLAIFLNWWHGKKNMENIKIIKEDLFKVDLSKATHIFTYLYPNIMDDLIFKFDKELKRGTRLVSVSFHFTSKREKEVIDLKRGRYQLTQKIYVYEF
jgi:hypothetical protein